MLAENLGAFVIAAFALSGSPGPATLGLSAAAVTFGLRRSLMLMTGIIVGVLLVFAAAAAGLTGLILAQPLLGPIVTAASVLYMLWLAWQHRDRAAALRCHVRECAELLGRHVPGRRQSEGLCGDGRALLRLHARGGARRGRVAQGSILLAVMIWSISLGCSPVGACPHHAQPGWSRAINIVFAVAARLGRGRPALTPGTSLAPKRSSGDPGDRP